MDFTLNEQQIELQRVARDFAQKEMILSCIGNGREEYSFTKRLAKKIC